jgi:hypothetical protein
MSHSDGVGLTYCLHQNYSQQTCENQVSGAITDMQSMQRNLHLHPVGISQSAQNRPNKVSEQVVIRQGNHS